MQNEPAATVTVGCTSAVMNGLILTGHFWKIWQVFSCTFYAPVGLELDRTFCDSSADSDPEVKQCVLTAEQGENWHLTA